MKNRLFPVLMILVMLVAACGTTDIKNDNKSANVEKNRELEKVQLLLATQSTAMYYAFLAHEKGFFNDEGLDVELVCCSGGAPAVERIGSEQANFGIVAVPSLFPAWNNDIDIQVIYQINSTNIFDLIVRSPSTLQDISQLKGKVIGVTDLGGAEVQMVRSLIARAGLNADKDFTIKAIGNDSKTILNAFETGEIAAFCGGAHDLVSLYAKGFPAKSLLPREYKTLPSTAIIANGKIIDDRPDLVEKIARAIAKSIDYSIKNRQETFTVMKKTFPDEYSDERIGKSFLDTFINLSTPLDSEKGYGFIDRKSWEKLLEQFTEGEAPVLTKKIDLDKYLNAEFLEKVNQFK